MSQPVWETPAGSLGTISEGLFFQVPIEATDPQGGSITYELLAGTLPTGIQLNRNGLIEGVPATSTLVQGVPTDVDTDVTSTFAVRALTTQGVLNDRTFSLTVTGQDIPEFVTPAGNLGQYYTGDVFNSQRNELSIEYTDADPGDTVVVSLDDGELPPGLTLNSDGTITGYIGVTPSLPGTADPGYDISNYDQYPFDFPARQINRSYQFTVALSDGKNKNTRTFSIDVIARSSLSADTMQITADSETITADAMPIPVPVITNYPTDGFIGTFRHDNFFAYQFEGFDFDNEDFDFEIVAGDSGELPPNLILERETGWLKGFLTNQGATEETFEFSITIYKSLDPTIASQPYNYSMKVIGDIDQEVVWTNSTLITGTTDVYSIGNIANGETSTLYVGAESASGKTLLFEFKQGNYPEIGGVYNKLPQGLTLLQDGLIAGRVSFNTFALDGGTTTFDADLATRLETSPTTFDKSFNFTIRAYTADGTVSVFRKFRITMERKYQSPYQALYIQTMPPNEDRELINSLLYNSDIFVPDLLYRKDDPNFGVVRKLQYVHAYSLNTGSLEEYVNALSQNHFWKKLVISEINVAVARDENDNILYEAVYADIEDNGVNKDREGPGQSITWPKPFTYDGTEYTTVYPNSLPNMRDRVIDVIGEDNIVLPLWMSSRQDDGRVLGFRRAVVLCYAKPNEGNQIKYRIQTKFGEILNRVDFTADRYIIDNTLTQNWVVNEDSTDGGNWSPTPALTTSFNVDQNENPTTSGDPTTFDANSLTFHKPVDIYTTSDSQNSYVLFPKTNILE